LICQGIFSNPIDNFFELRLVLVIPQVHGLVFKVGVQFTEQLDTTESLVKCGLGGVKNAISILQLAVEKTDENVEIIHRLLPP
jgi:hypothetical protein